jgi:hypothetical protein
VAYAHITIHVLDSAHQHSRRAEPPETSPRQIARSHCDSNAQRPPTLPGPRLCLSFASWQSSRLSPQARAAPRPRHLQLAPQPNKTTAQPNRTLRRHVTAVAAASPSPPRRHRRQGRPSLPARGCVAAGSPPPPRRRRLTAARRRRRCFLPRPHSYPTGIPAPVVPLLRSSRR